MKNSERNDDATLMTLAKPLKVIFDFSGCHAAEHARLIYNLNFFFVNYYYSLLWVNDFISCVYACEATVDLFLKEAYPFPLILLLIFIFMFYRQKHLPSAQ